MTAAEGPQQLDDLLPVRSATGHALSVLHIDDQEHPRGGTGVIDDEMNRVNETISTCVKQQQPYLEVGLAGIRAVRGVITKSIIHVGDGVADKVLYPLFGFGGEGKVVQVSSVIVGNVNEITQARPRYSLASAFGCLRNGFVSPRA
jgi:hypothetical protein